MIPVVCWILLAVFIGGARGSWATPSDRVTGTEDVRKCYGDLETNGDISHLLLDVNTPESIDYFCRRVHRLKKCIAENEHRISNAENTDYYRRIRGINNFYLNVCPPGTELTQRYKGNAPCFQLIKNKILSCGSNLPDMLSYKMQNNLTARCCSLREHRACVAVAAHQQCGKEAGEVAERILLQYFKSELDGCEMHNLRRLCSGQEGPGSDSGGDWDPDRDWVHHSAPDLGQEDWDRRTTLPEGWKRPKHHHKGGAPTTGASWTVVFSLSFVLFVFFIAK